MGNTTLVSLTAIKKVINQMVKNEYIPKQYQ